MRTIPTTHMVNSIIEQPIRWIPKLALSLGFEFLTEQINQCWNRAGIRFVKICSA